jgi:hypothetical protein
MKESPNKHNTNPPLRGKQRVRPPWLTYFINSVTSALLRVFRSFSKRTLDPYNNESRFYKLQNF